MIALSDSVVRSIRVSEGLFRLLDTSADAVAVFGPDLTHVYVNDGVCRLVQMPRAQILGRRYDEIPISRPNALAMQEAIARVFATGLPERVEVRGVHRDTKAPVVFDISYHAEVGEGGHIELVVGVSRDITRLRFAEETARASAERLGILLESAGVAISGVDRALRVTFANRLAQTELCAALGEHVAYLGLSLHDLPSAAPLIAPIEHVLSHGESMTFEQDFTAAEHTRRWSFQVRPEHGDDGAVTGAVVMAREVTLERQREAQLQLAERLAALGRIAAGVGHEISNPLVALYGNLELVALSTRALRKEHGELAAQLTDHLEMLSEATAAAQRIRGIIDELGMLAKSDEAPTGRVELHEVVRGVVKNLAPAWQQKARLIVHAPRVPPIAGSRLRLHQVVSNLVSNALMAFPAGRRPEDNTVVVEVRRSGRWVVLEVTDDGEGIAEASLPRVFDPFFTTREVGSGMGLGLTIVHGIVTNHGGSIDISSTLSRGTQVTVRLPLPGDRDD